MNGARRRREKRHTYMLRRAPACALSIRPVPFRKTRLNYHRFKKVAALYPKVKKSSIRKNVIRRMGFLERCDGRSAAELRGAGAVSPSAMMEAKLYCRALGVVVALRLHCAFANGRVLFYRFGRPGRSPGRVAVPSKTDLRQLPLSVSPASPVSRRH